MQDLKLRAETLIEKLFELDAIGLAPTVAEIRALDQVAARSARVVVDSCAGCGSRLTPQIRAVGFGLTCKNCEEATR